MVSSSSTFKIIPLSKNVYNVNLHFINRVQQTYKIQEKQNFHIQSYYSKSNLSNSIMPYSILQTKQPWFCNSSNIVYNHISFGKCFLDVYDKHTKTKTNYIFSDNDVYKNNKKILDNPSIFVIYPGVFYRYVYGNKGATTLGLNVSFDNNCNHDNIQTASDICNNLVYNEYEFEKINKTNPQNMLNVYDICEDTGDVNKISEYNDTEIGNSQPYEDEKRNLIKRWNESAWII